VEPVLPLIRSGDKTIELRLTGSKLSDGRIVDTLAIGDRFAGVPLSNSLAYRCVMEVTAPIESHDSHGAAWEAHREKALPHALGTINTANQAQKFINKSFYNGRSPPRKPVLAIPVRAVAWFDS